MWLYIRSPTRNHGNDDSGGDLPGQEEVCEERVRSGIQWLGTDGHHCCQLHPEGHQRHSGVGWEYCFFIILLWK